MLENVFHYFRANTGLIVTRLTAGIAVFLGVWLATRIVARVVERTLRHKGTRGQTLASIVRSVITLSGTTAAVVMGLSQLGIDVATVLAGAGVVGLAVGFGAQTLVKDCISGFFLILDDVVEVGDAAEIDGKSGVVERVGLRVTQLRAFNGQLWYIPNGTITSVGNTNRGFSRAIVLLKVSYGQDAARAGDAVRQAVAAWTEENAELVLEPPSIDGVVELGDTALTMRIVVKVPAGKAWGVEVELRTRAKAALESAGIAMGVATRMLVDERGPAPERAART